MVDAYSMRNWKLSGQSGHDHFFDSFDKFGPATDVSTDKMLAETASRAASQHETYQELMLTPTGHELEALAKSLGWTDDLGDMQQKLLANGLPQILADASQQNNAAELSRDKILRCDLPRPIQAARSTALPVPGVTRQAQRGGVCPDSLWIPDGWRRTVYRSTRSALRRSQPGDA